MVDTDATDNLPESSQITEGAPPSPPATTLRLILGAIAMQAGTKLLTEAVDRAVLGRHPADVEPPNPGKIRKVAAGKLAAIATKSKPGAIAIAGGLLAKHIFDRGGNRLKARRHMARHHGAKHHETQQP